MLLRVEIAKGEDGITGGFERPALDRVFIVVKLVTKSVSNIGMLE